MKSNYTRMKEYLHFGKSLMESKFLGFFGWTRTKDAGDTNDGAYTQMKQKNSELSDNRKMAMKTFDKGNEQRHFGQSLKSRRLDIRSWNP